MNGRTFPHYLKRAVVALLLLMTVSACSTTPYVWAADLPQERARPDPERATFAAGDGLVVTVSGEEGLSGAHVVGIDGTIALPNVGAVHISGLSTKAAESAVKKRLSRILAEPHVSIVVISRSIEISVLGEVTSRGKYLLKAGDGVATALALAGGVTEFGNKNAIFLIRATEPLRIRFRMKDLLRGGSSAEAFALRDGDLLVVE